MSEQEESDILHDLIETLSDVEEYLDENWKAQAVRVAGKSGARLGIALINLLEKAIIYRYSKSPRAAQNIATDASLTTAAINRAYKWMTSGSKVQDLPQHFPPSKNNPHKIENPVVNDFVLQNYGKYKIVNNRLVKVP